MAEVAIPTLESDASSVVRARVRARSARRRLSELPVPEPRRPGEPVLSEELAEMRKAERY